MQNVNKDVVDSRGHGHGSQWSDSSHHGVNQEFSHIRNNITFQKY